MTTEPPALNSHQLSPARSQYTQGRYQRWPRCVQILRDLAFAYPIDLGSQRGSTNLQHPVISCAASNSPLTTSEVADNRNNGPDTSGPASDPTSPAPP
jgi:hypothetical protein